LIKILAFNNRGSDIITRFSKKLKKPEQLFNTAIPDGFTLRTSEEMKQMRRGR